jgi:AraC-like DNA-binding protein
MTGKLADIYQSETVLIQDYHCGASPKSTSAVEHAEHFEITYTRTGAFHYQFRSKAQGIDNSLLWLTNAGLEYRIRHDHTVRDTCTIFRFPPDLLRIGCELFSTKPGPTDFQFPVSVVPVTARMDYLHHRLFHERDSLAVDSLALRFLEEVFASFFGSAKIKTNPSDYLERMERAKTYILENFDKNISLKEIARNAFMSEFHFSRVFRQITHRSPHQYLLDVRFQHAILLLRNTSQTVTDVCYASGFQNFPHFVAAFTRRYGISPLQFKKQDFVRIA